MTSHDFYDQTERIYATEYTNATEYTKNATEYTKNGCDGITTPNGFMWLQARKC